MRILFDSTELAGWGRNGARDVVLNGQAVYEVADIILANTKKLFHRGNELSSLQFTVSQFFATTKEAEVWMLTHFRALSKTGIAQIQCGEPGDYTTVTAANALLAAMPQARPSGCAIDVTYSILAPEFTTASPVDWPGDNTGGSAAVILTGTEAISNGATQVAVTYSTPFGTAPVVTCSVVMPDGSGSNIFATIREDLATVAGFTAELSGPAPDADHTLNWIAISAS